MRLVRPVLVTMLTLYPYTVKMRENITGILLEEILFGQEAMISTLRDPGPGLMELLGDSLPGIMVSQITRITRTVLLLQSLQVAALMTLIARTTN